jgi:hypothetical protein
MKFWTAISIVLIFASTALGDIGLNRQLKEKLKAEVRGLQTEINNASKEIAQLKKDKAAISATLHSMEEWGNSQEEAKLHYHEAVGRLEEQLSKASAILLKEKKRNEEMLLRYHMLKKIMGCLTGALLAALYVGFGSRVAMLLAPVLGPWGFALQYLGPVAAYAVGYILALTIF